MNISRGKSKYDLMNIVSLVLKKFLYPKHGQFKSQLRKPVHQIWVSKNYPSRSEVSSLPIGRAFKFQLLVGWKLETIWKKSATLRAKKEARKKWLVSPLETTADYWIPVCRCRQSKENRENCTYKPEVLSTSFKWGTAARILLVILCECQESMVN